MKKNNINIFDFKEQFSSREWEYIKDEKFPYNIFYDCWTKKEAVLKADGRGLISTLDRIDTMQLEGITIDNQYWFSVKKISSKIMHVILPTILDKRTFSYIMLISKLIQSDRMILG